MPDKVVEKGQKVIFLHLWNERIPTLPSNGADFGWANRIRRRLMHSLRLLAEHIQSNPSLVDIQAIGAVTVLLMPGDSFAQRLGFSLLPYRNPLGQFGEFWENFYSWWLMWAYNVVTLRQKRLLNLRRMEMWISMEAFLKRYASLNG